jgi:hypothetical protein
MLNILTTVATWAPSAYYGLGVAGVLMMPSVLKSRKDGELAIEKYPDIFTKVDELRKDITIHHKHEIPSYAGAIGTNFGPHALLLINEQFSNVDKDAFGFIFKHECGHIKSNHSFISNVLSMTASAVSTYTVPYLKSLLPWWVAPIAYALPCFVGFNFQTISLGICEFLADEFAFKYATDDELLGIERFLEVEIALNKELHLKNPVFSKEGNNKADLCHSSVNKRLQLTRYEKKQRNLGDRDISSKNEQQKMEGIRKCLIAMCVKAKFVVDESVKNNRKYNIKDYSKYLSYQGPLFLQSTLRPNFYALPSVKGNTDKKDVIN